MKVIKNVLFLSVTMCLILYMAGVWSVTKYGFDTDLLWHLKIGEDILLTKSIFLENSYTWLQNTLWTQQEWLFDIIIYGVVSIFGIVGFYIMHLSFQFSYIWLSLKSNNYHFKMLSLLLFFTMYVKLPFNQTNRPAEYSTYLLVVLIWLYDKKFKIKPIVYLIIGVFLSNFHCGSAVASLTLIVMLFAIDIILNFVFNKMNHGASTLTFGFSFQYCLSILSFIIGICVNPYGIKQVKNMFSVMNLNSTKYINEWQPFHTTSFISWIIIVSIIISFGYALHKHAWEKNTITHIIVMSAFLVLSFTSAKGFIMFYYIFIMYGYKYVDEMVYDFFKIVNVGPEFIYEKFNFTYLKKMYNDKYIHMIILILCISFGTLVASFNQKSIDNLISDKETCYINDFVIYELRNLSENKEDSFKILNGYITGNYFLYYDIPVFIDTRQMPYAKEFGWSSAVDDYFDTNINDYEAMDIFFDKYDFNYVICNSEYNINNYMQHVSDYWCLKYSDTDSDIYIWELVY